MGTYVPTEGQEACQVGAVWSQLKEDWLVPTFRENGMMWMKGAPLHQLMLYWIGNEKGSEFAEDVNMLPVTIPVGSHLPHATGVGWAERLNGGNGVAVCSFSDGATSEGDFHAALNFAGVMKARTLFFCQNNHWAISTPRDIQTASRTIGEKAFAYGFPGIQIDGNDIFACIAAVKEALRFIRETNTPVLIEALTYRVGAHTTSDNPKIYREESEVDLWRVKDPIDRLAKYLGLSDAERQRIADDAKSLVANELQKAFDTPDPEVTDMFDYLFSQMHPELEAQKQQILRENQ